MPYFMQKHEIVVLKRTQICPPVEKKRLAIFTVLRIRTFLVGSGRRIRILALINYPISTFLVCVKAINTSRITFI
jgi:hypothetical protein